MRRKIERLRRRFRGGPRVLAAVLATLVLSAGLFTTVLAQDIVLVTDSDGAEHRLLASGLTPEEMVQMAGLVAKSTDEIVYTENGNGSSRVTIQRSFPVSVKADGVWLKADVVGGTVADLLEECGVSLQDEDYVEPAADTALKPGLQAEVKRVDYQEETTRAEVAEEEVDAYLETLLAAEPDSPFRKSNAGIYDVTYRHRLVNGEPQSSEVLSLTPIITPRDPGSTAFTPGVPCSTIAEFEGVEMGVDGLPVNASRVMRSAVCTAYSSSGGRGASGLGLYCGTVAVNPRVIPYGTRLFITSPDQSFVYGFAIATDTGGAMMEGRVDIDLYFATNAECLRFGKRALDVYILD